MKGIDICWHNSEPNAVITDWKKLKESVAFIIPRDGWGTDNTDAKLVEYVQKARSVGIGVPCVYHFIYAINIQEAILNAENAIRNVRKAGLDKNTVIWCDIEYDTVTAAKKRGVTLTNKMQRDIAEAFCNYILAQDYPTGIYANRDYIQNIYGKSILDDYDLWLADLEGEADYPCVYRQDGWHGKFSGISGEVDTDTFIGQYTAGTAKKGEKSMIVCTEKELVSNLIKLGSGSPPSSYANYYPYNLLYWDGKRWYADCNNLYKALFNGRKIDHPEAGTYQADLSNTGDCDEWGLMEQCTDRSNDFAKLGNHFRCLYMKGHFGGYVGYEWEVEGQGIVNAVEATPRWEDGIQYSYVDTNGTRRWCKGGESAGTWEMHGLATKWVDYEEENIMPEPIEKTQIDMDTFISFLPYIRKGSTGEAVKLLQACLKDLGFYSDEIDGSAGSLTDKAIKDYQAATGLYQDGVFGTKSWTKMLEG